MTTLTPILDNIAILSGDVTVLARQAHTAIASGRDKTALEKINEMLLAARHVNVLANLIREAIDADDVRQIADGDLEAATEVYQEV